MSRVRLTNKTRIANDPSDMEGNRQDCGKKTRMNKYTNFDPAKDDVGGRGNKKTDGSMLHEQDVKGRNEMNVGEMKLRQAKAWQASKLATKLAIYLLGEKAPSSMVKAQAAEFLSLGNAKLAKAVNRFAKTQYLYAQEEDEVQETKQEVTEQPAEQEAKQEVTEQETKEVEQACGDVAAEQCEDCEKVEQAEQEEVEQACGDVAAEQCEDCEKVEQAEDAPEEQLVQQADEDEEIDDACLASLFEQNSNTLVASKKNVESKKVGVQKLSQPTVKVASSKGVNLESIWEGAPDVSKIFN